MLTGERHEKENAEACLKPSKEALVFSHLQQAH